LKMVHGSNACAKRNEALHEPWNKHGAPTELDEEQGVGGYRHGAPQQPAKGALFMGESPIRRIGRFATERPRACPCRKARGVKQSR
jgi:hypothetical protein